MSITSGFEKKMVTVELYGHSGPVTDYYYDTNDVSQLIAHARSLEAQNEALRDLLERLTLFVKPLLDVDTGDHEYGWHWEQIEGKKIVGEVDCALEKLIG